MSTRHPISGECPRQRKTTSSSNTTCWGGQSNPQPPTCSPWWEFTRPSYLFYEIHNVASLIEILHTVFLSVYVLRSNRAFRVFATLIAHSWSAYKNAHLQFQSKTWIIFIFISFMTQSQCFIFSPSYVAYCSLVLWCVSTNKNWITIWLILYFPSIYLQMMNMQRCN